MKTTTRRKGLKSKFWYITKVWMLLFIFVGTFAVLINLWGQGIPLAQYPRIVLNTFSSPLVVAVFVFIWMVFLGLVFFNIEKISK